MVQWMLDALDDVPFRAIASLTPLVVAIHNLEEYPRLVPYARRHGIHVDYTSVGIAVGLATLLPIPVTIFGVRGPKQSRRMQLVLLTPAILAVNAASHVGQTLVFQDYSPGTISAVALNIPFAIYLFRRACRENYLSQAQLRRTLILGAALMGPLALVLQLIGRLGSSYVRLLRA